MRPLTRFSILFAVAAIAACNAYDPNLGNQPFRCGDGEERCPDGYRCVVFSPTQELCEEEDGGDDVDGGGGNFNCDDDSSIEPNNDLASATSTPIPTQATSFSLVTLAICPADDIDVFRFGVDINGRNLRTDISFDATQTSLILEVFNDSGTTIRTGMEVGGNAGLVRAEIPNMPPGEYFVSVKSGTGLQNNYAVEIEISGP